MGSQVLRSLLSICLFLCLIIFSPNLASAALRPNYYANVCPDVESIVREAVKTKIHQTFTTIPGTLRLFFHDCAIQGCDSSIMIQSKGNNTAEKDHPDNLSLAGDGFDTVIKAKAAVDKAPGCKNKVSCADILTMATRDVVSLSGGPSYRVELGRLDGLISTSSSVNGSLPKPTFNLDQLTSFFNTLGLNRKDMIALSAAHTVGFSHCSRFAARIYNFSRHNKVDPALNKSYVAELQSLCPIGVDSRIAVNMDPISHKKFDNIYYKNLQQGMGLFTSDQILYTDFRSRPFVNLWASNNAAFERAFITGMTKLGRVRVKTGRSRYGNIRQDCAAFNS
ncbi:hypothetical protein DCAR_0312302 [Daucus carota subsp. sativus]|uniref:Peroxidase n=2 Tax=Daucus carota subsp. sativus TaxID=79200 RepID=A0AAF0WR97_DAUCS|nr:hypothetical protein DCAR_0312302 [Daucus carota subsp. sativus]